MSSLLLNTDFFLGFLESYPAALTVFDMDGTIVFVNSQGCKLVKQSKEELIGQQIQDFVVDTSLTNRIVSRVMSKGYIEDELSISQGNGITVNIRLAALLVKNSDGKPMGIVGMARGANEAMDKNENIALTIQRILDQFPESNMLTVEEVAHELRVNKETVRRWVRSGRLPSVKLARGIRIPSEVIKDLIRINLG